MVRQDTEHRFGGPWTEIKLTVLKKYLQGYTIALKKQKFELVYIDAFAGSGEYVPASELEQELKARVGSAGYALANDPPFQHYFFIEKHAGRGDQLEAAVNKYGRTNAHVLRGEANAEVQRLCREINWYDPRQHKRGVLFLDPYGMAVEWKTLEAIAATKAIDLWYLFPINALLRQAAHDYDKMEEYKRAAFTRVLGTDEWQKEIYRPPAQQNLFGDGPTAERDADVAKFDLYIKRRLSQLFPRVLNPLPLMDGNLQKFSLYFAISNDSPKALERAEGIARDIMKSV